MQSIWNFIVRESSLQEMANFDDYPGDFRLWSGDREIRLKIWSLPDYPGEFTALRTEMNDQDPDKTSCVSEFI